MLRYAISDRRLFPGGEQERKERLILQAVALAYEGVDFFQLREKDLDDAALFALTTAVRDAVHATGTVMQVVLNGPRQLSTRAGVGWHCTAGLLEQPSDSTHCVSCSVHTLDEVEQQRTRASLLLFAPVFDKTVASQPVQPGAGLEALARAVERARGTPVLALGGVTLQNAPLCLASGAAGVAGIRLFLRASRSQHSV